MDHKEKVSTHKIWALMFNVFARVFILFYMHMLDYNRYSLHENLIRDFHRLDNLYASRGLVWNEE